MAHQLLGEPVNHAFGAAVQAGRHTFMKWRDLGTLEPGLDQSAIEEFARRADKRTARQFVKRLGNLTRALACRLPTSYIVVSHGQIECQPI